MKTFLYRGFNREGRRVKGVIDALDLKDAREKLSGRGILTERIDTAANNDTERRLFAGSRASLDSGSIRAEFYRAVATMLNAGLPLVTALDIQLEQTPEAQDRLARHIAAVRDRVRDGEQLVSALPDSGVSVTAFESALLESGERTGTLHTVMAELADYLDEAGRVQQTLRTACLYPAIIVVLALLVGTGVMGFLVPQMARVFTEAGMTLPAITRLVIVLGTWFVPVILPALLGGAALTAALVRQGWRQPPRRMAWEQVIARMPVAGPGFRALTTLRFARTAALLLRGGLPLVDTIRLAGRATGSLWLAHVLEQGAESVRQGASFSRVLATTPVLGAELSSWVRAGEASGDLAGMLSHAGRRQQQRWSSYLERVVALIEPALIVAVALFVLLVALAILLPILSLNQQLA